jgi:hypothetical protein
MVTFVLYLCASMTPAEINQEIYKYHRENHAASVVAVVQDCEEK